MTHSYPIPRWVVAAMATVAMAGMLVACAGPSATSQSISDLESDQATTGSATPSGTAPVPTTVTQATQNLYNGQSFYGQVQITANTNALSNLPGVNATPSSSGTATPGGSNQLSATIDQWYMQPDNMKLRVVTATNSKADNSEMVYDGKTLSIYDAANNQAIQIRDRAQMVLFLSIAELDLLPQVQLYQLHQMLQNVAQNAQVSQDGAATVAGRPTTGYTITPQTPSNIQSIKVWRDDQTGAPLRLEVTDSNGNTALNLEYTKFDPTASISSNDFNFLPPSNATVVTPTPDNIARFAGFSSTTMQNAESSAGFPLYQITRLPAGISQQSVQMNNPGNYTTVAILYGSGSSDISTSLIEKPSNVRLPYIHGGRVVSTNGVDYTVYQDADMVVVNWLQGNTALTLATTEAHNQAMAMAESVQPVAGQTQGTMGTPTPVATSMPAQVTPMPTP